MVFIDSMSFGTCSWPMLILGHPHPLSSISLARLGYVPSIQLHVTNVTSHL